jgi:hypothetical protein
MVDFNIDLDRFSAYVVASRDKDLVSADALNLARDGQMSVQWAPFDYIPPSARLAIVGITPGRQQANNALRAFQQALRSGQTREAALRHAKFVGSFSGDMRGNLVPMLDLVDVHRHFGMASCDTLFDPTCEAIHFTSALRYPVFRGALNYNGTPGLLRTALLRQMTETFLAEEVRALPDALWLPLGPKSAAAMQHLVMMGVIPADRVLQGMPHPSPSNNERIKYFLRLKEKTALSVKTRADMIDAARSALLAQVAKLPPALLNEGVSH